MTQSRLREGSAKAGETSGVDLEIQFPLFRSTKVHEAGVAELDEVFRLPVGDVLVVDEVGGHSGNPTTNPDNRLLQCREALHFVVGDEQGHRDDRVDPFSHEKVIEQGFPLSRVIREPIQGEVIPGANQRRLDTVNHLAIEPAVHKRRDHRDVLRATGRETLRRTGGHKAQSPG